MRVLVWWFIMMNGGGRRPKRAQRVVPILTWLTPIGACLSVINVTISLCTGEWLKSIERIPIDPPNGTHKEEFQIKRTVSGLWSLCYSNMSVELEMHCFPIDYFAKDRYQADPHDSTMAIPYAVTRAGPLFVVAALLLGTAIFSSTLGHVSRPHRVAMFIGGIIFIIAGLIMLIGLVVYLSVLQSEIGTKLRPRNSLETPLFTYSYGFGFMLVVVGFLSTELTGISAIFWYTYWHQLDWAQKAISNSDDSTQLNFLGENERDPMTSSSTYVHPSGNYNRHQSHSQHHRHHHYSRHPQESLTFYPAMTSNGRKIGWHCDLHHPEFKYPNNFYGTGPRPKKGTTCPSRHAHFYDEDDDFELGLPIPPPPPLPRDLTATTTVSGDEFLGDFSRRGDGGVRRTTPV